MTSRIRAALSIAAACVPVVVMSACGGSGNASGVETSSIQYVEGTSYALKEPATTTTTTTTTPFVATPGEGTNPNEQSHTVATGDSLYGIAEKYGVAPDLLCKYNGWTDCPNHFFAVGDTVLIPPGADVPGAASSTSSDSATASGTDSIDSATDGAATEEGAGCVHTIVAGDNPSRVATKYGITVDELSNANLNNPVWNTFLIGSTLNIPANGDC